MIHNDHLGTPQKMTDSTGAVVWAADYKPFGEATITVSTITNNLRGIGQYFDAEIGLLYNYFRNLNTTNGRYNEADPIGIQKGRNHLYIYVKNRPLRLVDPYGLFGAGGTGTTPFGHGDFPGSDYFDYNLEDNDPATGPFNDPERHFRDLSRSEADVNMAIAFCDKEAFERAMHRAQDYFSHYRHGYRYDPFSWNRCLGFGHLCPLINPTGADKNVDDWIDAARWTQEKLDSWKKMCGCRK
jgi:RHS repeat-associated protein